MRKGPRVSATQRDASRASVARSSRSYHADAGTRSGSLSHGLPGVVSLSEGYYWFEPDGTETTDVADIQTFDGTVTGLHDSGGPVAASPLVINNRNIPDGDMYRRLFGQGIVDLLRLDNLVGSVMFSTSIRKIGSPVATRDTILYLPNIFGFYSYIFSDLLRLSGGIHESVLESPYDTGYWYPTAGGVGDGAGNKVGDIYHVGLAIHRLPNVGNYAEIWIEGNAMHGDIIEDSASLSVPNPKEGIVLWADVPMPDPGATAIVPTDVWAMNSDAAAIHEMGPILIKRFGDANRTDQVAKIMRDHYRDPDTLPATAT